MIIYYNLWLPKLIKKVQQWYCLIGKMYIYKVIFFKESCYYGNIESDIFEYLINMPLTFSSDNSHIGWPTARACVR